MQSESICLLHEFFFCIFCPVTLACYSLKGSNLQFATSATPMTHSQNFVLNSRNSWRSLARNFHQAWCKAGKSPGANFPKWICFQVMSTLASKSGFVEFWDLPVFLSFFINVSWGNWYLSIVRIFRQTRVQPPQIPENFYRSIPRHPWTKSRPLFGWLG